MNDNCIAKESSLPIFREIIEAFESIFDALNENADFIYGKVNSIREKIEPEDEKVKPNPSGTVVDRLWQQISQLRDVNYKLSRTRENLQGLVG